MFGVLDSYANKSFASVSVLEKLKLKMLPLSPDQSMLKLGANGLHTVVIGVCVREIQRFTCWNWKKKHLWHTKEIHTTDANQRIEQTARDRPKAAIPL